MAVRKGLVKQVLRMTTDPLHTPTLKEKLSGMWPRIGSAIVLIPLALGAVLMGGYWLAGLFAVAVLFMAGEWENLTPDSRDRWVGFAARVLGAGLVLLAAVPLGDLQAFGVPLGHWESGVQPTILCALAASAIYVLALMRQRQGAMLESVWPPVSGFLYIAVPSVLLILMRGDDAEGRNQLLVFLAIIWAMDSGAYFAGKSIGGPKLAPKLSPNKTWAGLIGGMAAAAVAGPAMAGILAVAAQARPQDVIGLDIGIMGFALAGAVLGGISQIGDILESSLKRRAGVKDSGTLIPGHGGVLDRVDGMLFAAPLYFVILQLMAAQVSP